MRLFKWVWHNSISISLSLILFCALSWVAMFEVFKLADKHELVYPVGLLFFLVHIYFLYLLKYSEDRFSKINKRIKSLESKEDKPCIT